MLARDYAVSKELSRKWCRNLNYTLISLSSSSSAANEEFADEFRDGNDESRRRVSSTN